MRAQTAQRPGAGPARQLQDDAAAAVVADADTDLAAQLAAHAVFGNDDAGAGALALVAGERARAVVAADDEVYVAADGAVRWARADEDGFKTIDLGTTAPVTAVAVNRTRTYVAAVAGDAVVVVATRGGRPRTVAESATVVQIGWHPLARDDDALVVLDADGLALYDVAVGDAPDAAVAFGAGDGFGLDDAAGLDPAGFCFGPPGPGLGAMATYVLSVDGDVFVVCPFVPRVCAVPVADMREAVDWAAADERRTPAAGRAAARAQLTWVVAAARDALDPARAAGVAARAGADGLAVAVGVFARPAGGTPVLQGPFSQQPFPRQLYGGRAHAIAATAVGSATALAVAFAGGRVTLLLAPAAPRARWAPAELPPLVVLESVAFSAPAGDGPALLAAVGSKVVAGAGRRVAVLDCTRWHGALASALAGSAADVRAFMAAPPQTAVSVALGPAELAAPVASLAVVCNDVLAEAVVVLTAAGVRTAAVSPPTRPPAARPVSSAAPAFGVLPGALPDAGSLTPASRLRARASALRAEADFSLTSPAPASPAALQFLGSAVEAAVADMKAAHAVSLQVHRRLAAHRAELSRQLSAVADLVARQNALDRGQTAAVAAATARQAALHARVDTLLRRLAVGRSAPLSEAEKRWAQELRRMRLAVDGDRGLRARARADAAQVAALAKAAAAPFQPPPPVALDVGTVPRLRALLDSEARAVDHARSSLTGLLARVDRALAATRIE
ncbi:uncharacterized protein V1510DRAFT_431016 [Dipodascopsis tothii]|uniref:uncharacterized protein n=1 Tax=Dipodascopsis tothii TaxID=44089 RepID=UPI0034CDC4CA